MTQLTEVRTFVSEPQTMKTDPAGPFPVRSQSAAAAGAAAALADVAGAGGAHLGAAGHAEGGVDGGPGDLLQELGGGAGLLRGRLRSEVVGRVVRGKEEIPLQPREFRLLEYLMKHAGQVVTRTMLLENVWDYHFDPQTNVIDVHISRLRSKIDKGFAQPLLHTVRGAGYMIRDGAR